MLVKLKKAEVKDYIDFAYNLCFDLSKSCYPTYADGIKTKEDFIQVAMNSCEGEHSDIYLFYYNDVLQGWISYYFIPEDHYFSCENFAVENYMGIALEEFFSFVKKEFRGYDFFWGCSIRNEEAIQFFNQNHFEKIEESTVCLLHFDEYKIQEESQYICRITKDNYGDFEKIHSIFDEEMYWNCNRILENIEKWYIYVLYEQEHPVAAIYFIYSNILLEIFGVDFKKNHYDQKQFELLMIKALNEGKKLGAKHLYYFAEKEEKEVLQKIGYTIFDTYVCYMKKIE